MSTFRIRPDREERSYFRVDEVLSETGHYRTWPELFMSTSMATMAIRHKELKAKITVLHVKPRIVKPEGKGKKPNIEFQTKRSSREGLPTVIDVRVNDILVGQIKRGLSYSWCFDIPGLYNSGSTDTFGEAKKRVRDYFQGRK